MSVSSKQVLAKIDSLPSLPQIARQLLVRLDQSDVSYDEIARLIEADVALTAKVLKVVNSAYFGLQAKVGSVRKAVPMIGMESLKEMCVSITLMENLNGVLTRESGFDGTGFWVHSFGCGIAARELSAYVKYEERETAFVAGLLHDMGKLLLARYAPGPFVAAIKEVKKLGKPLVEMESSLIGTSHAVLGGALAEHWELPDEHVAAIRFHHDEHSKAPTAVEHRKIIQTIFLADHFVRTMRVGNSGNPASVNFETLFSKIGVNDAAQRGQLGDSIQDGVHEFKNLISIANS